MGTLVPHEFTLGGRMLRIRFGVPLLMAALSVTPVVASAQTFGGYLMSLSNNFACIDDANNCLVQGTNQVAISNAGRLELVNGQYATTGTAFTTFTQNIAATTVWNSSFNFGLVYAGFDPQADGFAFVMQSVGPLATGGGGSGIGFEGMANSAGVGFRSWDNNDVFVVANGVFPGFGLHGDPLTNWGNSRLVTGTVNLAYNGLGLLDITLTSNLGDAYHSVQAFDMSGLTPGSVHVGFTAGTGLSTEYAYVENWTMTTSNTVPEPSTVALMTVGMLAIAGLAVRQRRARA